MKSSRQLCGSSPKKILVIGRRGNGKSSLGNLLLEGPNWTHKFEVSDLAHSVDTHKSSIKSCYFDQLEIHDTTGFDDTVSSFMIVKEIQGIVSKMMGIDGIIFVLRFGRCDQWDKAVFITYLQFILSGVPKEMIGVVWTNSSDEYVVKNDVELYMNDHKEATQEVLFLKKLMERCGNKGCFINNPDPSSDKLLDYTKLRQRSVENVKQMIDSFHGSFSFVGILSNLSRMYIYYSTYTKENPLKVSVTAVTLIGSVLATLSQLSGFMPITSQSMSVYFSLLNKFIIQ